MSTASARIYRISRAGKTMLLKTPIDGSGRALDMLKREYHLGVGLSHHNVAAIYTWEESTPVGPGILMEYVDGRTLAAYLGENPRPAARSRVFDQLLEAVNYIHKHGVTHNDLKPGNIMISRANDDVKIIDFGLADADGETCQRQLGGTAGYASPELTARNRDADTRSDIYSLGVIMRDIFGSRYRHIWRKCMADDPQRRYRNLDSLTRAWRWRKKRTAVVAAAAVALAVGAVIAFGSIKISSLQHEVDRYTQASKQLTDTITALRRDQTLAGDSLARLNLQLGEINREKAQTDSLTEVYIAGARTVIEKYKDAARRLRCTEESYQMYQKFTAEMNRSDSLFLRRNPHGGQDIYDQYAISVRLQGANELEAIVKTLPTLSDLTADLDEQIALMPLILDGRPWRLRSDP